MSVNSFFDWQVKENSLMIDSKYCMGMRKNMPMDPKVGPIFSMPLTYWVWRHHVVKQHRTTIRRRESRFNIRQAVLCTRQNSYRQTLVALNAIQLDYSSRVCTVTRHAMTSHRLAIHSPTHPLTIFTTHNMCMSILLCVWTLYLKHAPVTIYSIVARS